MAVSDVEAVLEFLRKNGFSKAESALREDMLEKVEFGSFHSDNDFSPMLPLLVPVRIPSTSHRSENFLGVDDDCSRSSLGSTSEDEFVSLASSTSDVCSSVVCSSEFINPYGIQSPSHGNSEASSERLSQFGTARDYHDFDMKNDLFWSEEKEDRNFMTPHFEGPDLLSCLSEDKFVTAYETQTQCDNPFILDKPCVFHIDPMNDEDVNPVSEYYRYHSSQLEDYSYPSSKGNDASDFQLNVVGESNDKDSSDFNVNMEEKDCIQSGNNGDKTGDHREENGRSHEIDNVGGDKDFATDEFLMCETPEDEYEVFNLRIVHRKNRTGFEANKDLPIVLNSIIAARYYVTEYIGSAAFSKVFQAHDLHTGVNVCLKIVKNDKDFFDQSLDEIKLLKLVNKYDPANDHHILRLYDYFYHQEHLFIVCELLGANLYEFQKFIQESGREAYFTLKRLQAIARQCLEALEYLHHLGIIHCDLKPENILMKNYRRCEIKVIDLGSSCFQSDNLGLYVQSRSYRAPEIILGFPYDQKIDIWSLGCILAELCSGKVLFPNDAVAVILARMIGMLGPIDMEMLLRGQETNKYFTRDYDLYRISEETDQMEYIIPEISISLEHHLQVTDIGFIDFVRHLLEINPKRRPTAKEALQHPWLLHSYDTSSH